MSPGLLEAIECFTEPLAIEQPLVVMGSGLAGCSLTSSTCVCSGTAPGPATGTRPEGQVVDIGMSMGGRRTGDGGEIGWRGGHSRPAGYQQPGRELGQRAVCEGGDGEPC